MIPDLDSYDIIEISSSGGKDSQAMTHYVGGLLRARGLLGRGVVVHADLGRMEWPGTKTVAFAQAKLAGLRFVARARPQGDLLQHAEELGRWMMPTHMIIHAFLRIGQGFDVEVEARLEHDDARDPITGRREWIIVGGPWVQTPRGERLLATKYHAKAGAVLAEAATAHEAYDDDDR